jgi:hypothetical protein
VVANVSDAELAELGFDSRVGIGIAARVDGVAEVRVDADRVDESIGAFGRFESSGETRIERERYSDEKGAGVWNTTEEQGEDP